ncbi:MAG: O-antigen ligase family protein [Intestinibacter sp.]|uniref:O-antigen ligase family protein n=1 Tax=Intestinibacter sp. TaxID=1965304 RepID=UPI003F171B3A
MKKIKFIGNIPIAFILLSFAGVFLVSESANRMLLFITSAYFLYLVISINKIVVKDIEVIGVLFMILILGIFMSLVHMNDYSLRNIVRDIFYVLNPIVFIWTGVTFRYKYGDRFDIFKIIVYIAVISSIINLLQIAKEPRILQVSSIYVFRNYIEIINAYTILIAIVLLFTNDHIKNECNFGTFKLNLFRILCIASFIIDFSRTNYICLFIILCPFVLPVIRKNIFKLRKIIYVLVFVVLATIIMPDLMETLFNKMIRSISEVNASVNWGTSRAIVDNWRGYEIYKAQNLYFSGNWFEQLFGFGFGKLIPVGIFSELVGVDTSEGGITILHNGYYMMLIKCGIVGVILYASVYLVGIRKIIIRIKNNKKNNLNLYEPKLLLGIFIAFLLSTYVTTGIIHNKTDFIACFLIGYLSYLPSKKSCEKQVRNKKIS